MIGIIDSGIGGKGIEAEVKKLLPSVKIEYLTDAENFPYGTKPVKLLRTILIKNIETLIKKDAKIIVLACNSATVSSIAFLRRYFKNLPIVGVVPAIKTAAEVTKTLNIAIFATPITSKSAYQQELINEFCRGAKVYKIPFNNLAGLIEQGKISSATSKVEDIWSKYKDKNIDMIVLGCTHYTLIRSEIQKIVGSKVKLIDSNLAVARQVKKVYNKINSHSELVSESY